MTSINEYYHTHVQTDIVPHYRSKAHVYIKYNVNPELNNSKNE